MDTHGPVTLAAHACRGLTGSSLYTMCHLLQMGTKGDLLISLKYNTAEKTLEGLLLKATNLQKQDIIGLASITCTCMYPPMCHYNIPTLVYISYSICRDGTSSLWVIVDMFMLCR